MLFSQSDTHRFELLENGAYGWSKRWSSAILFADVVSRQIGKRHRVYWSAQGNAWMVRRAFSFGPVDRAEGK